MGFWDSRERERERVREKERDSTHINFRYYQALKVLEELEHTHLALVEKYRFTQILAKSMAPIRDEIKLKVKSLSTPPPLSLSVPVL